MVCSQFLGDPRAKGQGTPVIQAERYERAPLELTKIMCPGSPALCDPLGLACVLQVHLFSFLTELDPHKRCYKSTLT